MADKNFDLRFPTMTRVEKPTLPLVAALQASADPTSALPLLMGEWLEMSGGTTGQLARTATAAGTEIGTPTYPYFEWQGSTCVQTSLKGTVLLPPYNAWTLLWDGTANPPTAVGDALTICTMLAGHTWAGYSVPRLDSGGAGYTIGFAMEPIPAAEADRLYFRANY